jgi:hypothetical protein
VGNIGLIYYSRSEEIRPEDLLIAINWRYPALFGSSVGEKKSKNNYREWMVDKKEAPVYLYDSRGLKMVHHLGFEPKTY